MKPVKLPLRHTVPSGSRSWALYFLQSLLASFAVLNIGGLGTAHILSPVLLFLCFLFFKKNDSYYEQSAPAPSCLRVTRLVSFVFLFLYLASQYRYLTGTLENRFFRAFVLLLTAAGLWLLFYHTVRFLYCALKTFCFFSAPAVPMPAKLSWLCFGLLLLCFLPYFLMNYPAVMTPDSLSQYRQAVGITAYSNHHPWVHTMLFKLLYTVGFSLTSNTYHAIAFYTVFQMCVMAAVFTCLIRFLYSLGVSRTFLWLTGAFFGLVPYNALYAVTIWKDVLFSAWVLLYSINLFRCLLTVRSGRSLRTCRSALFLLAFSGALLCLFRSNGWYAFLLSVPFTLWFFRRQLRFLLPVQLFVIAAVLLVKGPVMDAFHVMPPAFVESISIPVQQVSRIIARGLPLTGEQDALINRVCSSEYIAESYNPVISDPIKALISYGHPEYLEAHKSSFLRLWAELGLRYPLEYVHAWVDQTSGYWYPATASMLTNEGISPNDEGLMSQPLLRGKIPIKVNEILGKLYTVFPFYGLLYSMGAFLWLSLFLAGNCLVNGRRQNLILFLLPWTVIFTLLLATPVASDLRYAYSLMICMPLLFAAGLEPGKLSAGSISD